MRAAALTDQLIDEIRDGTPSQFSYHFPKADILRSQELMMISFSHKEPPPPLVRVTYGLEEKTSRTYRTSFRIGRDEECEICIKSDYVSRMHAEVAFVDGRWWVSDSNSSNGIYLADHRIEQVPITENMVIRLGIHGPEVAFEILRTHSPRPRKEDKVSQYVEHYFGSTANDTAVGEHTMYVRKAYAQVQSKQKRRYDKILVVLALFVVGLGVYALKEHQQVTRQRALARELFYEMKSLDIDIGNLQQSIALSNNKQGALALQNFQNRRGEMEKNYDHFLATLHVYNPNMSEQDKLILRVARIFGECELDMPPQFSAEVYRYIKYWQSTGRLEKAVNTAKEKGYVRFISQEMLAENLPPQFFYLALQESDFDTYASGPPTRMGIAKGMWQFIPSEAVKYGLRLGPLVDLRRPDPGDDRHHYDRETRAAGRYLKDLFDTDAQASGLLVMACYNWGEDRVLPLVQGMPLNPRDRNFWQLLVKHRDKIPQQTYDYVFYIFSAAVIGENPRLFGFNFDNPLTEQGTL
jgi:membrane-bound lytic murein transglycosylase D